MKDIGIVPISSPLFQKNLKSITMNRILRLFLNDISYTFKDFYQLSNNLLKEKSNDLSAEEKSYNKRLLKQISHESNAYLKLGGNYPYWI